jgi:ABC-2 type transport system permease protein
LAPSPLGLWPAVGKLLRMRLVMMLSSFRRASRRRKAVTVFVYLLVLGGVALISLFSWGVLTVLRSPQFAEQFGDATPVLEAVPVVVFSAAFVGILLTSFGVLLQALYLAGDMDFLLATPTPIRAVFLSKMLQAILPNLALIAAFVLPVLIGLGVSSGYSWLYYPLVLVMAAALALAAAGAAGMLVMAVVRIFPARRVAEVLGFIGAISSFFCSQSANLAQYSGVDGEQAAGTVTLLARMDQPWSPLAWAGRGVVSMGAGRWGEGLGYSALALAVSLGIFYLALVFAERLYYSGWARMQVQMRKTKSARPKRAADGRLRAISGAWNMLTLRIPAPVRTLVRKDFIIFRRDLRHTSQLIMPLIFGAIYAFMFLRGGGEAPPGQAEAPEWLMQAMNNMLLYVQVALALFVGWMMVTRLATIGFSQEGKNYWMLKSAPISAKQLLTGKFLVALLPALAGSWLFLVGVTVLRGGSAGMLIYSLLVVALILMGNVGTNLAFGVAWANFQWDDPRQMTRGSNGCVSMLVSVIYLPLAMVLFFGAPFVTDLLQAPHILGQAIGLLVGGGFTLLCTIVPLRLALARVPRLAEE